MNQHAVIEGRGEEIARYALNHPDQQFRLSVLEESAADLPLHGPGSETWENLIRVIESFRGELGSIPPGAASTEGLYPY